MYILLMAHPVSWVCQMVTSVESQDLHRKIEVSQMAEMPWPWVFSAEAAAWCDESLTDMIDFLLIGWIHPLPQ